MFKSRAVAYVNPSSSCNTVLIVSRYVDIRYLDLTSPLSSHAFHDGDRSPTGCEHSTKHTNRVVTNLTRTTTSHVTRIDTQLTTLGERVDYMTATLNIAIAAPDEHTANILLDLLDDKLTMPINLLFTSRKSVKKRTVLFFFG
jgi:hypothetical protein